MKKLISLFVLATATGFFELSAADGTVNLTNYDSNNPILLCNPPLFSLAPMEGVLVQVIGGPVGGALQVLASTRPGNPTVFPLTEPGFFDGGFGVVPGVPEGSQGHFQVRAWRGAPTFATALLTGRSAVFQNAVGASINQPPGLPPAPAPLNGMPSFLLDGIFCIPEPPTFSLGLIAALVLLFRSVAIGPRRRAITSVLSVRR